MGKSYISKAEDLRKNGTILMKWGSKNGLSVIPTPLIDKVKFTILAKGTNGQDRNDFYLDMEEFRQLCEQIDNGKFEEKLKNDNKNDYPEAYKYTAGEEGCKKLNFGLYKGSPVVQIQIKTGDKWNNKIITFNMSEMRTMSFLFKLTMGLIPCSDYYAKLKNAWWEGDADRSRYHSSGETGEPIPEGFVEPPSAESESPWSDASDNPWT